MKVNSAKMLEQGTEVSCIALCILGPHWLTLAIRIIYVYYAVNNSG